MVNPNIFMGLSYHTKNTQRLYTYILKYSTTIFNVHLVFYILKNKIKNENKRRIIKYYKITQKNKHELLNIS